jgi:hypothetical protein
MKTPFSRPRNMRKIVVDNCTYYWSYGDWVRIISYDRTYDRRVPISEVTGIPGPEIERGRWKKYFRLTPSMIASYIRRIIDDN